MHAVAAGGVEPGHADPVALLDVLDALADRRDIADALMPRNEGRGLDRPVALGRVQIGVTDARRLDRDLDPPSPTSGTGTSSMLSGSPNARTTAAFIVFAMVFLRRMRIGRDRRGGRSPP
jgi:hypothetical protein